MNPVKRCLFSFRRTEKAVEIHDMKESAFMAAAGSRAIVKALSELRRAERLVGLAFYLDTRPLNSKETCVDFVRCGPRVPGAGYEENHVRWAVREWREREDRQARHPAVWKNNP